MLLRSARSVLVQLWTQPLGILLHPAFQTPDATRKRACAGESATGSGVPRKQEHGERKVARVVRETGPGALPKARNSEPVFYCASDRGLKKMAM